MPRLINPVRGSRPAAVFALMTGLALAPDPLGEQFQGGGFCTMEFTGDVRRIR